MARQELAFWGNYEGVNRIQNCEVREAFLGFSDVRSNRGAQEISDYIFGVLHKYECAEKLVAQTYDGAAVMASELNGLQVKIKEKCQELFLHIAMYMNSIWFCHNQPSPSPSGKSFSRLLSGTKSIKRTHLLDEKENAATPCIIMEFKLEACTNNFPIHARSQPVIPDITGELWSLGQWDLRYGLWIWFHVLVIKSINTFSPNGLWWYIQFALFRSIQSKAMNIGLCCEHQRHCQLKGISVTSLILCKTILSWKKVNWGWRRKLAATSPRRWRETNLQLFSTSSLCKWRPD